MDASAGRVIQMIFNVIEEANRQMPKDRRLEKSPGTELFGRTGRLDSLGFVTFIVALEQKVDREFGALISLTDERAMSRTVSPFKTVETLAEYVSGLLEEKLNGAKKV